MATPPDSANFPPSDDGNAVDLDELLRSLRRKEGTWVDWGTACQTLQKAGYSPQRIFEETGFEPIQQNQIVVATQVYASMLSVGVSSDVEAYFAQKGSDSLYEFRILAQSDRAAAAELVFEKGIDSEGSHEVAKALKDFAWMTTPPEGFSKQAGDAVAHHYWKLARQQSDLQTRSRMIAQGLRFAATDSARKQVEKLLTDFSVARSRPAPILPLYRLESEEELPRVIPVIGKWPLAVSDFKAVPLIDEEGPFRLVKFSGTGAWVALPGWQVVLNAEDPVVILAHTEQLPVSTDAPEEVLVIVDRAKRKWNEDGYFVASEAEQLKIEWFETEPKLSLLGQVILVLRPKKVLDEGMSRDPWQLDE